MNTIAILTSGGDAPGMNAAVRAAVRYGINRGLNVLGVNRGFSGLIENDFTEMNVRSVSDIIQRGGTILRSARCPEFLSSEGQELAVRFLQRRGVDGLIVIGGNGSFMGAEALWKHGLPTIGIPGTIDNDLAYTDYTLGFDTACNTALEAINKLRDTMNSHDRISIIEVMGRDCGDIALMAGLGGGAEIILVPEIQLSIGEIMHQISQNMKNGKLSTIIVLAEGAGKAEQLKSRIMQRCKCEVRASVLGHLQRGGSPSARDRYLGTSFGVRAVRLLLERAGGRVCGIKNEIFFDMDICEALAMKKKFDFDLYNMAGIVANS